MSLIRAIVSADRVRNNDRDTSTSLDMSYVTDRVIVMSTPAGSFPHNLY